MDSRKMDISKEVWAFLRLLGLTALIVAAYLVIDFSYDQLASPFQAQIAVGQLQDNATSYAAARAASTTRLVPTLVFWGAVVLLVVLWVRYGLRMWDSYVKKEEVEGKLSK